MQDQDNLPFDDIVTLHEDSSPKKTITENSYNASDIEVLEGLEAVRRRPGMYIGGTDSRAFHHLFAEIMDNSMDEALAGYATHIDINIQEDGSISVADNGRGIPVDAHPKFKEKSALEVIMTTLHAGGKFNSNVYQTSGGLHGVGISVVNALSDKMDVYVIRNKEIYHQQYAEGLPLTPLKNIGKTNKKSGTKVIFHPDPKIFGSELRFDLAQIYRMARSKAFLFAGIHITWECSPSLRTQHDKIPEKDSFYFPEGLKSYLSSSIEQEARIIPEFFSGKSGNIGTHGSMEWAIAWVTDHSFVQSYCNTIPTPEGGTHEVGLRNILTRGLRHYAELLGNKRASAILAEDILNAAAIILSVFIQEPQFSGQTKDRLASSSAIRLVENSIRDAFDHWLTANPQESSRLLEWIISSAEERTKRRQEKDNHRKSMVRKLRLPGKLADCTHNASAGSELFIVEGDSAGGSAKQARDRSIQAILPLRGKILNVASAGKEKFASNQQISDLIQALGCGVRTKYSSKDLRYSRIIIMTDADVDGAHIASLLITFFYQEMPQLILDGHLYLAVPPLYRLSRGDKIVYAKTDAHKEELLQTIFSGSQKVEISRFKGLGEMLPAQLRETTMDIKKRTLLQISIPTEKETETKEAIEGLMGVRSENRFHFIQNNAKFLTTEQIDI